MRVFFLIVRNLTDHVTKRKLYYGEIRQLGRPEFFFEPRRILKSESDTLAINATDTEPYTVGSTTSLFFNRGDLYETCRKWLEEKYPEDILVEWDSRISWNSKYDRFVAGSDKMRKFFEDSYDHDIADFLSHQ